MKKIVAIIMTLVIMFSMTSMVFAEEEDFPTVEVPSDEEEIYPPEEETPDFEMDEDWYTRIEIQNKKYTIRYNLGAMNDAIENLPIATISANDIALEVINNKTNDKYTSEDNIIIKAKKIKYDNIKFIIKKIDGERINKSFIVYKDWQIQFYVI